MAMTEQPSREMVLAEPAGPRLDAWVAEFVLGCTPEMVRSAVAHVMGQEAPLFPICGCPIPGKDVAPTSLMDALARANRHRPHSDHIDGGFWRYSQNIAAAWDVIEEMVRKNWNAIINDAERHSAYHRELDSQHYVGPCPFEVQVGGDRPQPYVFAAFERPGGVVCGGGASRTDGGTHATAAASAICRAALLAVLEAK